MNFYNKAVKTCKTDVFLLNLKYISPYKSVNPAQKFLRDNRIVYAMGIQKAADISGVSAVPLCLSQGLFYLYIKL